MQAKPTSVNERPENKVLSHRVSPQIGPGAGPRPPNTYYLGRWSPIELISTEYALAPWALTTYLDVRYDVVCGL